MAINGANPEYLSPQPIAFGKIRELRAVRQFDVLLFAAVLINAAVGAYYLNVALQAENISTGGTATMRTQMIAIIIGIAAALLLSSIDYKYFRVPSYALYIVSVLLLVATSLWGWGGETKGNRNWLRAFGASVQPSELAKITFVVVSATFFERIADKTAARIDYAKLVFYASLPIGLIVLQKDTGTAIVFMFIFASMLFASGIKYRYILMLAGAAVASLPILWMFVLRDLQKMRIMTFLNPDLDTLNSGFQVLQSKAAIGAGQLFGRELGDLGQARFVQVPEFLNDFIFTVIAEKTGFFGSAAFMLLIVFILLRCYYIASKARDRYGAFMVVGLASMLAFHYVENIGMCVGLLPVTGIPLPFVSSGGTAKVANFVAIGIILSVSMMREKVPPKRRAHPRL
ncbi:MAG: rod shape-determining protein RodA [Clostridiales bacterium]|jgi:rod shape determining protein RodA|nr:rod shape-determining protein RodA [Clostridiales bacterium]